jgi:hypothetical protein
MTTTITTPSPSIQDYTFNDFQDATWAGSGYTNVALGLDVIPSYISTLTPTIAIARTQASPALVTLIMATLIPSIRVGVTLSPTKCKLGLKLNDFILPTYRKPITSGELVVLVIDKGTVNLVSKDETIILAANDEQYVLPIEI